MNKALEPVAIKQYPYKEYCRKYYKKIAGTGRCTHCLNPAEEGKMKCKYHNELQNEYNRKRRAERKLAGLCVICKEPAKEIYKDRIFCETHLLASREESRRYYQEHKLQGLCVVCWEPASLGVKCEKHRKATNEYQMTRRYYAKMEQNEEI